MPAAKKTIDQQIAAAEAKLAKLKAMKEGTALDKTSPGMDQLQAALDVVCKENSCTVVDVIKTVSRLRKLGLKIERPIRKPRGKNKVVGKEG